MATAIKNAPQWVLLGGQSFAAVLAEKKMGGWVASSPEVDVSAEGETPADALHALADELEALVREAVAYIRTRHRDLTA